jgi:hypothetical protein
MQNETDAQIRRNIIEKISTLEHYYLIVKNYIADKEIEDTEVIATLHSYKNDLTAISTHILALYQLRGQRTKITWDSLLTNIETTLTTIHNAINPQPRATIKAALNMSNPRIEEVMAYVAELKKCYRYEAKYQRQSMNLN